MKTEDDDLEKPKMGRLTEGLDQALLKAMSRPSIQNQGIDLRLPLGVSGKIVPKILIAHARNVPRGKRGTATFKRRDGWTDYIDRTGRFREKRDDLELLGGDDRERLKSAICAVKDRARCHTDSVMIALFIVLPRGLSKHGNTNVMNLLVQKVQATGRLCAAAIHRGKTPAGNPHLHMRITSRPVTLVDDGWDVGHGKLWPDPRSMKAYRERVAAVINAEMDREGLDHALYPRLHPGRLKDLGVDRPALRRLSPRAALRDDPDITAPADQFNLVWNDCIRRGEDPRKDSYIIERQAAQAQERELKQRQRTQAVAAKQIKRAERISKSPEVQALLRENAELRASKSDPELSPLEPSLIEAVAKAHKSLKFELPSDWQANPEKRAQALVVHDLFLQRRAQADEKQRRREAEAAATAQREKEERERTQAWLKQKLEEQRSLDRAKSQAEKLAAEQRRCKDEAQYRRIVLPLDQIADELELTRGVFRVGGTPQDYKLAAGRVAGWAAAIKFLEHQSPEYLRWVYHATRVAIANGKGAEAAAGHDEFEALFQGVQSVKEVAKGRNIDLDASAKPPGSLGGSSRTEGATQAAQRPPERGRNRDRDHGM